MKEVPVVVSVEAHDDFTVKVSFHDGTVRDVDIKPLIERGGVFASISTLPVFKEQICVLNGTVAWGSDPETCIDL